MLADSIFTTPSVEALFADTVELRYMLAVEAALAAAQAAAGLIPDAAAQRINEVCAQTDWSIELIATQTQLAGNPAIPVVNELKRRVGLLTPNLVGYVHVGATSQDLIDTALMLQLKAAFPLLQTALVDLIGQLKALADACGNTPLMGRTLLQHALPIMFGHKIAGWLDGLNRSAAHLEHMAQTGLVVQLGGPVGTLAQMGTEGPAIRKQVAEALGLGDAPAWHTQRDRLADIAAPLGTLNGLLGKLATDMILLMQTEVDELRERAEAGKGGSSSMPHKRNPVSATFMVAIAHQTPALVATLLGSMLQPHERAAGAWHSEWPVIRQLVKLTAANLYHANNLLTGLEVDTARMKTNSKN
ncbi:3-carboxy-cis,cis-muconate cycloisomerase [Fibrella sp. HMF5335]|uniref:3-carboxy-cis,cis-muconate cycloisomerase n=1 Tax=Fibrella rubiginis TaxID=2817060 RepID=A0A939GFX9_9BACT|nr:3-carboxy-cis,cis-muconate cycloisomerase [Fibrella rubiginis]MBO0938269.1 3-carboxy-cis,cis-muconate cycloisomerase [Fibrella rubiginis]